MTTPTEHNNYVYIHVYIQCSGGGFLIDLYTVQLQYSVVLVICAATGRMHVGYTTDSCTMRLNHYIDHNTQ